MSWANLPYEYSRHIPATGPKPVKSKHYVTEEALEFHRRQQELADTEHKLSAERRAAATVRSIDFTRQAIIREYVERGLVVRYSSTGEPIALSTLMSIGWRLVPDGAGGYHLDPPAARAPHVERLGDGQRT